jgi:hypothetical protein
MDAGYALLRSLMAMALILVFLSALAGLIAHAHALAAKYSHEANSCVDERNQLIRGIVNGD